MVQFAKAASPRTLRFILCVLCVEKTLANIPRGERREFRRDRRDDHNFKLNHYLVPLPEGPSAFRGDPSCFSPFQLFQPVSTGLKHRNLL